jgi:hypothetical protein
MPAVTLKAHYDGERIVLDEPFELTPDSPLMVTVLPTAADDQSGHAQWTALSAQNLGRAYAESEPDYTQADVKRP